MIEICNRGDFVKAQTCRSVFVCRSCGQADHPAERRGFEPLKPFRGLLAFQAGQFNHSCTFPRIKKKNQPSDRLILCGERGIRTPGTVARTPHFECGPIDHSGISPVHSARKNLPFGTANIDIFFIFAHFRAEKITFG